MKTGFAVATTRYYINGKLRSAHFSSGFNRADRRVEAMKNIRAQTKMINELIRVIARLSYRLDRRNRELRANDEGTSSRCDRDALLRRRRL